MWLKRSRRWLSALGEGQEESLGWSTWISPGDTTDLGRRHEATQNPTITFPPREGAGQVATAIHEGSPVYPANCGLETSEGEPPADEETPAHPAPGQEAKPEESCSASSSRLSNTLPAEEEAE